MFCSKANVLEMVKVLMGEVKQTEDATLRGSLEIHLQVENSKGVHLYNKDDQRHEVLNSHALFATIQITHAQVEVNGDAK